MGYAVVDVRGVVFEGLGELVGYGGTDRYGVLSLTFAPLSWDCPYFDIHWFPFDGYECQAISRHVMMMNAIEARNGIMTWYCMR